MSDIELDSAFKLSAQARRARMFCIESIEGEELLNAIYWYDAIRRLRKLVDEDHSGPLARDLIHYLDAILFELSTSTDFD